MPRCLVFLSFRLLRSSLGWVVRSSDDLGTQLSVAYHSCRFDINDAGLYLTFHDYRLTPHPKSHNSFHTSHHIQLYSTTTHAWTEPDHQNLHLHLHLHPAISQNDPTPTDPFADADFGSPASSATAGAKANASRTSTPKIDDDLGGVAGGKIHIRESSSSCSCSFSSVFRNPL
jgi:hypothetical protein